MKKVLSSFKIAKLLLVTAFVLICGVLFAQGGSDSANALINGGTDTIVSSVFSFLEMKWPVIGTIGTILFLLSEALAAIPAIKANSVFQLISGILKSIFGKKSA